MRLQLHPQPDSRPRAPGDRSNELAPVGTGGVPTRAELARMRRGELGADRVAELMDLTRGLVAPVAPPEGDLVPNGTGWRVGEGGLGLRLYPRLTTWAVYSGGVTGALGPGWAHLLGFDHSFAMAGLLGLLPQALILGSIRLTAAMVARRLWRAPRPERLEDCPSGTTVRLAGVISSEATVPTLFRAEPSVLFKSVVGIAAQTQGIDFALDLASGQRARICVRGALLVDRPRRTCGPPACGPVSVDHWSERRRYSLKSDMFSGPSVWARLFGPARRYEASVGPGDRVEVCGVLHHEPDPDNLAPFARQMPVRAVLRAPGRYPLLVRRLTER